MAAAPRSMAVRQLVWLMASEMLLVWSNTPLRKRFQ